MGKGAMIAAKPNVVRIIAAMNRVGWGVHDTCVNCGMNNKTLAKILKGEMPHRIDTLYRLCEGLKIPIEQILINGTMSQPNLTLIEGRKRLTS
jgi:transcriptional regulator with XRE-family HTH domain